MISRRHAQGPLRRAALLGPRAHGPGLSLAADSTTAVTGMGAAAPPTTTTPVSPPHPAAARTETARAARAPRGGRFGLPDTVAGPAAALGRDGEAGGERR